MGHQPASRCWEMLGDADAAAAAAAGEILIAARSSVRALAACIVT